MAIDQLSYRKLSSFSLILHGWPERFPVEELLPLVERYFAKAGVDPQDGDVEGIAPPEFKSYSMRTIRRRIATGKIHGLTSMSAYHFVDREYKPSDDYFISVDMSYGDETAWFINAVSPETERHAMALDFLRDMLTFVSPCYGYSLELPLGHDPGLFAVGAFAYDRDTQNESYIWQQASHAMYDGFAHKQGRMRHVFAINILSRPHMETRIDGMPFADWVRTPGRGCIEEW